VDVSDLGSYISSCTSICFLVGVRMQLIIKLILY
jgi:hypothetical protein